MTTFLFWNLNRKPLAKLLRGLVDDHAPDIMLLAESQMPIDTLLLAINTGNTLKYHVSPEPMGTKIPSRLLVLSRLPVSFVQPFAGTNNVAVRHITPLLGEKTLLLAMHLNSKRNLDAFDQALYATRLREFIAATERKVGHTRTVVLGDLNMDPFETGVTGSESLHAVMDKRIAIKLSRRVNQEERYFFYNPMWGRLGDTTPGPPGTYYRPASGPTATYWHTFDQVLIRPDLLPNFREENLLVLVQIGAVSLLTAGGIPDAKVASDHLPLLFKI